MWKILIIDDDFQVLEGMKKAIPWESIDAVLVGEASDGACLLYTSPSPRD